MGDEQPTSSGTEGIDPKLAGLLSYIWIVGVVFIIISKDKFVRFHALQSIIMGVAFTIIGIVVSLIPFVWFFGWIVWPLYLVLVIVMMMKAYNGEKFKLPIIGDIAEKSA